MARSTRIAKKQTRLQFESLPATTSSSAQKSYSDAVRDRLANVRYGGARSRQRTPEKDSTSILPTPEPSSIAKAGTSSPLSSQLSSPTLPARQTPVRTETDLHDQADDDEDDILLPSSKRRKLAVGIAATSLNSSPRRSTRLTASSPTRKPPRSHVDTHLRSPWSDIGSPETSDQEANTISTKPPRRNLNKPKGTTNDGFVVHDDRVNSVSSEDDAIRKKPSRRPVKKGVDDFLVEDDIVEYVTSDSEQASTKQPRKSRKQSQKKSAARSRREKQELEDDLLDLQDSDDDDDGGGQRSRTRGGPVTTQRDEARTHLERLKQKRAQKGSTRLIISDEDEDDESDEAVDIEHISQGLRYNEESDDNSDSLIGAPEPQPETFDNDEGNEDIDDFVVEDIEQATTGRHNRPHPDIPLQFTSFASAKPKELFIHIIEWLVKNKISPAFSRDDDLYDLSFNRVDDQVKAQAGSRLISSAWSSTFKYAILARPTMTVEALPGLDEDHIRTCDACNRTNHPARYDFKFTGTPYDKGTLEPLDPEDDEDKSQEDEETPSDQSEPEQSETKSNISYDSQGHKLASERTHFYLGRYCAAAAEMGHKLTHWKHHLNSEVLTYLSEQGVLQADEIVRRDKQSHKKREKEAENIVDAMSETGVINELWRRFQADLDDARWGMEGHEGRGKARGKQRIGSVRVSGPDGRIGEWMEGGRYKEVLRVDSDSDA